MAGDGEHRDAAGSGRDGPDREKEAQIHTKLKAGEIRLYELEKQLAPVDAVRVRRGFIEHETGTTLENIGIFSIDVYRAATRNCENMIGAVQVPVGVAGPLAINGDYAKGTFWLPLATTEGALGRSPQGRSRRYRCDHHLARDDDRPCRLRRGHKRLCQARIRYQGRDGHEH